MNAPSINQTPAPNPIPSTDLRGVEEEQALLSGLLADDPEAWREFNFRYSRLLYRCISRVTSRFPGVCGPDDVREVYATLCMQLLANDKGKLRSFRPERGNKLGSWLGMLANHAAYDYLRGKRRQPRCEELASADDLAGSVPDPLEACVARERARAVTELLAEFSEKDREFVMLYFGEGRPPEEIARQMRISVKTVYSKKHKIRARLVALLEQRRIAA